MVRQEVVDLIQASSNTALKSLVESNRQLLEDAIDAKLQAKRTRRSKKPRSAGGSQDPTMSASEEGPADALSSATGDDEMLDSAARNPMTIGALMNPKD